MQHLFNYMQSGLNNKVWNTQYNINIEQTEKINNLTLDRSKNIACSLVGCRLDYTNSTLMGSRLRIFLGFNVCKAQSIMLSHISGDASASPFFKTLQKLHWLPIMWRIDYKVTTLMYKLLESGEPTYLRSRIMSKIFWRALRSLLSTTDNSNHVHPVRKLDHAPFIVPYHQYGTVCRMTLELHNLSPSFEADSKRTISNSPFNVLLWL